MILSLKPEDFVTYPGVVSSEVVDRVPALRFTPGDNGYARFVTKEHFIPPVRVAGWIKIDPGESVKGHKFDGIHVHLAHVGNDRNYVASIMRRDGNAKLAVEYGLNGYHSLTYNEGPEFMPGKLYLYNILWEEGKLTSWLGSETSFHEMSAEIPKSLYIPQGSVGFRLDNLNVTGAMTVRQERE